MNGHGLNGPVGRIGALVVATAAAVVFATGSAVTAQAAPVPVPAAAVMAPEPHIISSFAGALTGPRRALPRVPVVSVPVRSDVDGCNRNYGEKNQCIPTTLPNGQTDLCAYLAQRGFKAVKVKGTDTRRIDLNRNGVACD